VTKFGMLTRAWQDGSAIPPSQDAGLSIPEILGTFYIHARSMRNNNWILHGDETGCEEIFYMVDHKCCS